MLISLSNILSKYNLHPKSVIHVGAHWAEEHDDYVRNGIEKFVYVEPCMDSFITMVEKLSKIEGDEGWKGSTIPQPLLIVDATKGDYIRCFRCACGSEAKKEAMYVSHDNQGQSNSLLKPSLHLDQHPNVVFTDAEVVTIVPLDSLKVTGDMLVMDCQGYEGEVIKGGIETLKQVQIIYTEVNRGQTYAGNMEIHDMDEFLAEYGFKRVETHWPSPNWTWGDAFYIKQPI